MGKQHLHQRAGGPAESTHPGGSSTRWNLGRWFQSTGSPRAPAWPSPGQSEPPRVTAATVRPLKWLRGREDPGAKAEPKGAWRGLWLLARPDRCRPALPTPLFLTRGCRGLYASQQWPAWVALHEGTCGAGAGGSTLGGDPFSSFLTHRVGQWEKGPAMRGSPQPEKPSPRPLPETGAFSGEPPWAEPTAAQPHPHLLWAPIPGAGLPPPPPLPCLPQPSGTRGPCMLQAGTAMALAGQSPWCERPLQGAGGVPAPAQAGPSCPYLTSRMDGLVSMMATMILSM